MTKNKLLRLDNVGIVVESLHDAISFFTELETPKLGVHETGSRPQDDSQMAEMHLKRAYDKPTKN